VASKELHDAFTKHGIFAACALDVRRTLLGRRPFQGGNEDRLFGSSFFGHRRFPRCTQEHVRNRAANRLTNPEKIRKIF
jgi:hypothetical protein